MPNIYEYTDYRKFLSDYQEEQRACNPVFSHRYFAQKAGFSSSGLLANIMNGKRNLSNPLISKFACALKLNKKEEEYFENLVRFNQAKTIDEKNRYYERMLKLSPLKARIIEQKRHEFYSQWWYSAVRELLFFYKFSDDYQDLARQLDPPITAEQAKKAIHILESLQLIERGNNGYYHQTESIITTGSGYQQSLHIKNFQLTTIDLAKQSLERHPKEVRDFSTLTLTLSSESMKKVRLEIEALQNRLLKIAEQDNDVNAVYQMNFQLYPMTKTGRISR